MRAMLGNNDRPSLLVVLCNYIDEKNFSFDVINGAWEGSVKDGYLFVRDEDCGLIDNICTDQDRLRGDYNDVFANFHDVNYIAPGYEYEPNAIDDDIPF